MIQSLQVKFCSYLFWLTSSIANICSSGEYVIAKNVDPAHSVIKNFGATCSEWHKLLKFEVLLAVSINLSSLFFTQLTSSTFCVFRLSFFAWRNSFAFNFKVVKSQWNLSWQKVTQRNGFSNFPESQLKSKRTIFCWFLDQSTVPALLFVSTYMVCERPLWKKLSTGRRNFLQRNFRIFPCSVVVVAVSFYCFQDRQIWDISITVPWAHLQQLWSLHSTCWFMSLVITIHYWNH